MRGPKEENDVQLSTLLQHKTNSFITGPTTVLLRHVNCCSIQLTLTSQGELAASQSKLLHHRNGLMIRSLHSVSVNWKHSRQIKFCCYGCL